MAKKGTSHDWSGPDQVRVTIVVEPGRVRPMLPKLLAGTRVHAALIAVGAIAAVVAGTIIVASSSTGREPRSPGTYSPWPTDSERLATKFGLQLNCARLTVFSADGAYARIDFEHGGPCDTFGAQATLILHRVDGVWVREFEASAWTCPMSQLPRPVATELGLCGRTVVPPRPVVPPPRGTL